MHVVRFVLFAEREWGKRDTGRDRTDRDGDWDRDRGIARKERDSDANIWGWRDRNAYLFVFILMCLLPAVIAAVTAVLCCYWIIW